jgi:anthranilate/para-aminobenzoate synthase component I
VLADYKSFCDQIIKGQEGVFFSVKNDLVGHHTYTGMGAKQLANFDDGPFPLFSINSFKGDISYHWHFEDFNYVAEQTEIEQIEALETFQSALGIKCLSDYTKESQASFETKIESLKEAARAGEFWVANFTQSLGAKFSSDTDVRREALKVFYEFLKLNQNHCGGVVVTDELIFCSLSPETFIIQDCETVKTFPIKGTGTETELLSSEKEIAELNMITDLMRNDLGQICDKVWMGRERYLTQEQGFFHARAEVQGHLKNDRLDFSDFKKLLPAGSISGAPKVRVLSILKDLESFDRGFYTGTFGVRLSPDKTLLNILIRTLFLDAETQSWNFPVGAGITIESDAEGEWKETLQKAQILSDCVKH